MKRYMFNCRLQDVKRVDTDVIIVGSGAAGLYTALNLDSRLSCVILNKSGKDKSNSMYAQGGISAVIQPNKCDDPQQHFNDTLAAGAGICDQTAVRVLVDEAWDNIAQLIEFKVPFDTHDGNLLLTREGGHGKNRILHCGGDATGLHLTNRLNEIVAERENIRVLDKMFLADILTDESGVVGVLALDQQNQRYYFAATKVIIASGGIGRVYQNSTNAICATGDGIAAASRAGATLANMEFVQFHPTAFIHPNQNGRFFLISEALRGEGAILRNHLGEPFMQGIHPLADLAPRDIVARAITMEMKKYNIPHVYLDITAKSRSFLQKRFPTIYRECLLHRIDIANDLIPVMPVQHYFMGGIKADTNSQTNIPGLYACGEASCTGVHGANRLASNSLLECLVFGRRCARHISEADFPAINTKDFQTESANTKNNSLDFGSYSDEIRRLCTEKCGIIRNEQELTQAYSRFSEMLELLDALELESPQSIETYNRALIAQAISQASIKRKKSVGAHFRSDDNSIGGNNNAL